MATESGSYENAFGYRRIVYGSLTIYSTEQIVREKKKTCAHPNLPRESSNDASLWRIRALGSRPSLLRGRGAEAARPVTTGSPYQQWDLRPPDDFPNFPAELPNFGGSVLSGGKATQGEAR